MKFVPILLSLTSKSLHVRRLVLILSQSTPSRRQHSHSHIRHSSLHLTIDYRGNYDSYVKTRDEKIKNDMRVYHAYQDKRAHMMEFIEKFRANAKRATMVQSRIKAVEVSCCSMVVLCVQYNSRDKQNFRSCLECRKWMLKHRNQSRLSQSGVLAFPTQNRLDGPLYPWMTFRLITSQYWKMGRKSQWTTGCCKW